MYSGPMISVFSLLDHSVFFSTTFVSLLKNINIFIWSAKQILYFYQVWGLIKIGKVNCLFIILFQSATKWKIETILCTGGSTQLNQILLFHDLQIWVCHVNSLCFVSSMSELFFFISAENKMKGIWDHIFLVSTKGTGLKAVIL